MPGVASRFFHNAHQFDSGHSRTGYIKQSCIVNRDRQTKKVCQLRSGRRTSIWGNGGCRHAHHVRSRAPARFFPERPERLTSQIWLPLGFCAPARRIPGQKPAPIGNFSLFVPSLHSLHAFSPFRREKAQSLRMPVTPASSRAVLRPSQRFLFRRTPAVRRHASSASDAASKAKETAAKAQQSLSKLTATAGPAIANAAQNLGNALRRVGGRTGKVIAFVDCKGTHLSDWHCDLCSALR